MARASPLRRALLAFYELEEASGTRQDASGNGRHLTDNNTVTMVPGRVGNAAQLTAANSEFLSRTNDLLTGSEWTVSLHLRLDTLAARRGVLSIGNTPLDGTPRILLQANNADLVLYAEGSGNRIVTGTVLVVSTWYHVVLTRDSARNVRGYVNGVERLNTNLAAPAGNAANFYLGSGFSTYHDGQLDQVGIWARVLTAAEATWLYNGGAGRSYAAIATG